jgi:hypothetical protein
MIELALSVIVTLGAGAATIWFYYSDEILKAIFWLIVTVVCGKWLAGNAEMFSQ